MVPGWRGSEELIRRMVDNVVDNAIVHNKPRRLGQGLHGQ
jgi:hypothetical protein